MVLRATRQRRGRIIAGLSAVAAPAVVTLVAFTHVSPVLPALLYVGAICFATLVGGNGAGVVAMLAIALLLRNVRLRHALPFVFIGNVGEEGEGDLRGMRHIFSTPRWKDAIAYSLVLDGAGCDTIVAEALGSRRFEVIVRGPGGHSWSDFGQPNPIVTISRIVSRFSQTPLPSSPKTTFNFGVISGGTSVNSIPDLAQVSIDLRSASATELQRLEDELRAVIQAEIPARGDGYPAKLSCELRKIGDRPAGELQGDSRLLEVILERSAKLIRVRGSSHLRQRLDQLLLCTAKVADLLGQHVLK